MIFYDKNGKRQPLVGYDDFCIEHKENGDDKMSFILPVSSPIYKEIGEETQIDYGDNEWLVKKIDDDKFDCALNFDFLKTRAYVDFKEETKPLAYILEKYLPDGWTVFGASVSSISRTIEFDVCTDFDVINECLKTYSVCFVWEIKNKSLYVYSQDIAVDGIGGYSSDFAVRLYAYGIDGLTIEDAVVNGSRYGKKYIDSVPNASRIVEISWTDTTYTSAANLYSAASSKLSTLVTKLSAQQGAGEYITKNLNLKSLSFKGESTDFATRLYAYGAEGMTLEEATVNGARYGLKYVDNNQYADKVVCVVWKDERYTLVDELYRAAQEKLAELAYPTRSYECAVIDLAKQNEAFSFLKFKMHYKATLLDPDRKTRLVHKVVEYDEYPDEPSRNKVTLSCTTGTIQSYVNSVVTGLKEEVKSQDTSFNAKMLMNTAFLLGCFGTYQYEDSNGNKFYMDNADPNQAENVWIFNSNGIGHSSNGINGPYTSSWTSADELTMSIINAMVIRGEYVEAGSVSATQINQSYTDGVLKQSYEAAEGIIKNTISDTQKMLHNEDGTGELDVIQERMAQFQETIDGWSARFTDGFKGGINHLLNSSALNGTTFWGYNGTVTSVSNEETKGNTVSNSAFRMTGANGYSYIRQDIKNLIEHSNYTISGKFNKRGNQGTLTIVIGYRNDDGDFVQEDELYRSDIAQSMEWKSFEIYIGDMKRVDAVIEFIWSSSAYKELLLADIMINDGAVPLSWTPAPDEIYTLNTKIDRNGVTVDNPNALRKTNMTYEEFAGYYNSEKVFSLNADETYTKNLFINGQVVIAQSVNGERKGILITPYHSSTESGVNIAVVD